MLQFFTALANVKAVMEMIVKYIIEPSKAAWKAWRKKKLEDAYQDRVDNRNEVIKDIVVESKKEPTEESDEALRNAHRKL